MSNLPALAVSGNGASAQIYATFYNWTGTQMQVQVAASANGGATWRKPVRVTTSNFGDEFFPWISIDGSGRLVATWMDRRNDPANLLYQPFVAYSTDRGKTFQGDLPFSSIMSNPMPSGSSFFDAFGAYRNQISVGDTTYAIWMDTRTGAFQIEVGGASF